MNFNSISEAALAYALWGWPVFPCHWMTDDKVCSCGDPECRSPGKHPLGELVPRGLHQATREPLIIQEWWRRYPTANVAIATGNGLAVVDTDMKDGVSGEDTLKNWERQYGKLPETLMCLTGGGGIHRYFIYPKDIKIQSRVNVLGAKVDVRADGGYVLAPASNHKSGRLYEWDKDNSPANIAPEDMPAPLLEALRGSHKREQQRLEDSIPNQQSSDACQLPPDQVEEIQSALAAIPADDRDTWLRMGMSLHSTGAENQAYALWSEWSATSPKFNEKDQRRTWRSFRNDRTDASTLNSLFYEAKGFGWVCPMPAPLQITVRATEQPVEPRAETTHLKTTPSRLLSLPGPLGTFAEWLERSAQVRQPQFSIHGALALGSAICNRVWRSDRDNWTPLYFLVIGPSGCGKDNTRAKIISTLLEGGFGELVHGDGYTSDGAVFSVLQQAPAHIALIDEIGMMLEGSKSKGNHVGASALRSLMQMWSSPSNQVWSKGYSRMGQTKKQKAETEIKPIYNPCLTIFGLTTPGQFYSQLSSKEINNGFLNRFLIVETNTPFGGHQDVPLMPIPSEIIEWMKVARRPLGNMGSENNPNSPVTPRMVPFSDEALAVKNEYQNFVLELRRNMDRRDELLSRCVEQAMRLSVILAVNDDPIRPVIGKEHMEWARDYVGWYTDRLLDAVENKVADSGHEEKLNLIMDALQQAGDKGMTTTELARGLRAIPTKARRDLMADLQEMGKIEARQEQGITKPYIKWYLRDA